MMLAVVSTDLAKDIHGLVQHSVLVYALLEMVLAAIRKLDVVTLDQALEFAGSLNEDNRIVVLSVLGYDTST
jgi:hypothetical protein